MNSSRLLIYITAWELNGLISHTINIPYRVRRVFCSRMLAGYCKRPSQCSTLIKVSTFGTSILSFSSCFGVSASTLLNFASLWPSCTSILSSMEMSLISGSSLTLSSSVLSVLFFTLFWCVFWCFLRWSLRMKRLPHSAHWKRFSPVCVLKCRCSSSDRVKLFPQNSQLHTNGRSPVCQRRCALRCDVFPYTLPQPGMWQMCCFRFVVFPVVAASWQFGHRHLLQRLVPVTWLDKGPALYALVKW